MSAIGIVNWFLVRPLRRFGSRLVAEQRAGCSPGQGGSARMKDRPGFRSVEVPLRGGMPVILKRPVKRKRNVLCWLASRKKAPHWAGLLCCYPSTSSMTTALRVFRCPSHQSSESIRHWGEDGFRSAMNSACFGDLATISNSLQISLVIETI